MERSIPFFSPAILALHIPFALLELPAEIAYVLWLAMLVLSLALVISVKLPGASSIGRLNEFLLITLVIIISGSGQQTLSTGYFTLELVLASLVAVHYGTSRPWLSGRAFVIVSAKPNYVLPIGILMLARGNFGAVLIGGALSASLAAAGFVWIMPAGGLPVLIEQIGSSQEIHRLDSIERPVNTWIRIDALALIAKWANWDPSTPSYLSGVLVLLAPAASKLFQHRRSEHLSAAQHLQTRVEPHLRDGLLLLTSLIAVYHHVYDVLAMLGLLAVLVLRPQSLALSRFSR